MLFYVCTDTYMGDATTDVAVEHLDNAFNASYISGTGNPETRASFRPFSAVIDLETMEVIISEFEDNGDLIGISLDQIVEAVEQANL